MSGMLDGLFYDKIIFEDKVLYNFHYKPARLSEEECAIADCLVKMDNYIKQENSFILIKRAMKITVILFEFV